MRYMIKNWEDFQHYKNRNPPWIKLHFELWTSKDWVMLADASRLALIVCMMLGSRSKGIIEDNVDYIRRVAHLDKEPNLKPLIDSGFLIPIDEPLADASDCKRLQADAIIETETEKRREETEAPKLSFGEFKKVLLSQEEHDKLVQREGPYRLSQAIEILDGYIASKGAKYKNHYAVMKSNSWVWEKVNKTSPRSMI